MIRTRNRLLVPGAALLVLVPLAFAAPPEAQLAGSAETPPVPAAAALESIDPPAAAGAMAPALAVDGADLVAVWIEPSEAPGGGHRLRFSRWSEGSWRAPVTITAGDDLFVNFADTPEIGRTGDGGLVVAWLARSAPGTYDYDVWLARSSGRSEPFAPLGRLNDDGVAAEHGFVSFVAEPRGARAFWLDGRRTPAGGAMTLRSAALLGDSIGASEEIDGRVCDCCSTAAAAVAGGTVIAYRDRTDEEVRDVRLALRRASGATSTVGVGTDGWRIEGCPVNGPALAADGAEVVVAWYTAAEGRARVAYARSSDAGRSLGAPVVLDAAAPAGRVTAVALGNGEAAIGWIANREGRGELRLVRIDPRGVAGAPRSIATVALGRASGRPRLARLGDRIAIAWTAGERAGEGRVRVALLPASALPPP